MWTGIVIAVLAVLFVVGALSALRPSAHEQALGTLRTEARDMKLNPRLVPCPEWLINGEGEKGTGMVALYGLMLPHGEITDTKLPLVEALVMDGEFEMVKGDDTLANHRCDVQGALGVVMQTGFVGIYWDENAFQLDGSTREIRAKKLTEIKENLQMWVKKVQA